MRLSAAVCMIALVVLNVHLAQAAHRQGRKGEVAISVIAAVACAIAAALNLAVYLRG